MNKIFISIIVAGVLIGGAVMLYVGSGKNSGPAVSDKSEATLSGSTQEIEILARGGYSPRNVVAKAGIPLTIKFKTQGTYDCSSSLSIPELNYRNNLPTTGETYVQIAPHKAGEVLKGTCGMGMYSFSVEFK